VTRRELGRHSQGFLEFTAACLLVMGMPRQPRVDPKACGGNDADERVHLGVDAARLDEWYRI
jgi:hypothetical protein